MYLAWLVAAIFVFGSANARWIFYVGPGMLSYGRLDAIISPGAVSSHVHQFQGANAVGSTYDYDTIRSESTCSSLMVQEDLSNYWSPAMYHYDGASNYSLMMGAFHVYYLHSTFGYSATNSSGNDSRLAFPEGLTMTAGMPDQRYINGSLPGSTASIFQCQRNATNDSPYSHDMRDFQRSGKNCDGSLRATVDFPSCWDGVHVTSPDQSHVAYPDVWTNVCPESHPIALMQLLFEYYWPVQDYPFDPTREDNWVLSSGDTSGFSLHADFTNGWNRTLLQQAIDECNVEEVGTEHCAPFAPWNNIQTPPCMPSGLYPNEDVGLNGHSLAALPGCNPLWTDNSTKPTCDTQPATPAIDLQLGPDLSSWNYMACPMQYTSTGLVLANYTIKADNMTLDTCLATCKAKGYIFAGITWGTECYCDNELQHGGQLVSDPNYACFVHCKDDYTSFCGGFGSLQVYEACQGNACFANSHQPTTPVTVSSGTVSSVSTASTATASAYKASSSAPAATSSAAPTATTHTRKSRTTHTKSATSSTASATPSPAAAPAPAPAPASPSASAPPSSNDSSEPGDDEATCD